MALLGGQGPREFLRRARQCGLAPTAVPGCRSTSVGRPRMLRQASPSSRKASGLISFAAFKGEGTTNFAWRAAAPFALDVVLSLIWGRVVAVRA